MTIQDGGVSLTRETREPDAERRPLETKRGRALIVESNPINAARIARAVGSGIGVASVEVIESTRAAAPYLDLRPELVVCSADDLRAALGWLADALPFTRLIVWTGRNSRTLLQAASRETRLGHVLGWPAFESMPRPWELTMAARRLTDPLAPRPDLRAMLGWGATTLRWAPETSADAEEAVAEIQARAEEMGAAQRIAQRAAAVAHELLMNAMYDAPVDENGCPRFQNDRRQRLELGARERPTLLLASDGVHLAIQVSDPFGTLQRSHVFEGIVRGMDGAAPTENGPRMVLDTRRGGAGLGMITVFSQVAVLIVDVSAKRLTEVTALFDLDVNARELRTMPVSLHYYES
jgi:hypothetical protein